MKSYKASTEPYVSMLCNLPKSYFAIDVKEDSILVVDSYVMYLMAKASGLKSNKKRAVNKRAKQVLITLLRDYAVVSKLQNDSTS